MNFFGRQLMAITYFFKLVIIIVDVTWRPPSDGELTLMLLNTGLTHLGGLGGLQMYKLQMQWGMCEYRIIIFSIFLCIFQL